MFENVKRIYEKAKEKEVDLSIAWPMVRNDDRLAGVKDHTDLDKAYKLISVYESLVTKLWCDGQVEALEELCKLFEADDKNGIKEFVERWQ